MDYIQRLKPLEATPSRTSAFDTGAPPVPFVSPDGATGGLSSDPSPTPPQENPQGPLSLMDAYLEYRKQLDASPPQASAFDEVLRPRRWFLPLMQIYRGAFSAGSPR